MKICKNCYYYQVFTPPMCTCLYVSVPNLVTGETRLVSCHEGRSLGNCGQIGKYFRLKDEDSTIK